MFLKQIPGEYVRMWVTVPPRSNVCRYDPKKRHGQCVPETVSTITVATVDATDSARIFNCLVYICSLLDSVGPLDRKMVLNEKLLTALRALSQFVRCLR